MSLTKRELETRVARIHPMSETAQSILRVLEDPKRSVSQLIRIVECDAPLTLRVLRLANSAAFALASEVESVAHAISYLGERAVVAAALSQGASEIFETPLDGYASEGTGLWSSSLRTAVASRLVAQQADIGVSPTLAYTGGLLRDIGKLVVSKELEGSTAEAVAQVDAGEARDFCAAERDLVGFDHTEVGSMIAGRFRLSPALAEVIRHHHAPSEASAEHAGLVCAVHVGDALSMMLGGEPSADNMAYRLESQAIDRLKLTGQGMQSLAAATLDEFSRTQEAFGSRS